MGRTGGRTEITTAADRARMVALVERDGVEAISLRTGRSKRSLRDLVARERQRAKGGA